MIIVALMLWNIVPKNLERESALRFPTFSHCQIVNKLSSSLSLYTRCDACGTCLIECLSLHTHDVMLVALTLWSIVPKNLSLSLSLSLSLYTHTHTQTHTRCDGCHTYVMEYRY